MSNPNYYSNFQSNMQPYTNMEMYGLATPMANGSDFLKRSDALSAGVPSSMDYFQGASKSLGNYDFTGALGSAYDGIGSLFKDSGFLGSTDANGIKTDGWGGTALSGVTAALSAYGAINSKKNADRMFGLQKDAYETNKKANIATTDTRYRDRQAARVASGPGYESVDKYMQANGLANRLA